MQIVYADIDVLLFYVQSFYCTFFYFPNLCLKHCFVTCVRVPVEGPRAQTYFGLDNIVILLFLTTELSLKNKPKITNHFQYISSCFN